VRRLGLRKLVFSVLYLEREPLLIVLPHHQALLSALQLLLQFFGVILIRCQLLRRAPELLSRLGELDYQLVAVALYLRIRQRMSRMRDAYSFSAVWESLIISSVAVGLLSACASASMRSV
jgi:hypothetical protein